MHIEYTPRGLLANLFRQGRKVAALFLLCVLGGVVYIVVAKPVYEASGSLLVKFGHNTPEQITHTGAEGGGIISQDDRREIMQSNLDILQSQSLLLDLVNETGPEKIYPGITEKVGTHDSPVQEAVRRLVSTDLTIKAAQSSNVIDIKMQNEDPELAARFIKRLMEVYIAKQAEIYDKPQTAFLAEQVKQASAKLEASQKKLEEFREKKGISSLDQELVELQRQRSEAGTASLETMDSAWDKLSDLQSEEKRLRAIYLSGSPEVIRAHQNVMLAETQLNSRQGDLKARAGSMTAKINRRIGVLEKERRAYDDLVRQVEIDEKNYKNYQANSEEAQINESLKQKNITSVVVVDEPVVPVKPAYPRKLLVLALSLLAGTVLSIGTALVCEVYDQRFTAPEQIESALGIPVMASFNRDERYV